MKINTLFSTYNKNYLYREQKMRTNEYISFRQRATSIPE